MCSKGRREDQFKGTKEAGFISKKELSNSEWCPTMEPTPWLHSDYPRTKFRVFSNKGLWPPPQAWLSWPTADVCTSHLLPEVNGGRQVQNFLQISWFLSFFFFFKRTDFVWEGTEVYIAGWLLLGMPRCHTRVPGIKCHLFLSHLRVNVRTGMWQMRVWALGPCHPCGSPK